MFYGNAETGPLVRYKTLICYDRLISFLCISPFGITYIALLVKENGPGEIWYYVPVSGTRLYNIFDRKISLFKAFKEPEYPFLYVVRGDGNIYVCNLIKSTDLDLSVFDESEDQYLDPQCN